MKDYRKNDLKVKQPESIDKDVQDLKNDVLNTLLPYKHKVSKNCSEMVKKITKLVLQFNQ